MAHSTQAVGRCAACCVNRGPESSPFDRHRPGDSRGPRLATPAVIISLAAREDGFGPGRDVELHFGEAGLSLDPAEPLDAPGAVLARTISRNLLLGWTSVDLRFYGWHACLTAALMATASIATA
jgi:hypothetical protein